MSIKEEMMEYFDKTRNLYYLPEEIKEKLFTFKKNGYYISVNTLDTAYITIEKTDFAFDYEYFSDTLVVKLYMHEILLKDADYYMAQMIDLMEFYNRITEVMDDLLVLLYKELDDCLGDVYSFYNIEILISDGMDLSALKNSRINKFIDKINEKWVKISSIM